MKLDLTCPVELKEWELVWDDYSHAQAYLRIRNLSSAALSELRGIVRWIDTASGNVTDKAFAVNDMSIVSGGVFTLPQSGSFSSRSVRIEAYFAYVATADGKVWEGDVRGLVEYPDPPVPPPRLRNALAAAAGQDAVCCAVAEDEVWYCVCGRPNPVGITLCVRCGRDRDSTLARYSPEAIEKMASAAGPYSRATVDMPVVEAESPRSVSVSAQEAGGKLRRLFVMLLLAALLAFAALGIRMIRYRLSDSAGLLPTSHVTNEMAGAQEQTTVSNK